MAEPNLNVEFSAVTDDKGKFRRLAKLLGLADGDHARGKCEHLWIACTRRGETDLPMWLVEDVLGEGGAAALVEAELARWASGRGDSKTRRLRIAGARRHCTWMSSKSEQSSNGGKSRASKASRVGGKFVKNLTSPNQRSDPSSDPIPEDQISDPPPVRAIAPSPEPAPTAAAPPPIPLDAEQLANYREARRVVQLELRAELESARREVAAELGVTDHGLLAQDPGERDLAMQLVAAGPGGLATAREQALHAIAMAKLEAIAEPAKFRWLTGAIFGERNFRRLVGTTAEEARRSPTTRGTAAPPRPRRKPAPTPIAPLVDPATFGDGARAYAQSLELLRHGQRAPPESSSAITDEKQSEPTAKAAT